VRPVVIAALLLTGCAPSPAPAPAPDVTTETWYKQAVGQLAATARTAGESFANGKADDAAAMIEKGESLESQVLAVPRPTLAAMEAASDLDDLYGRMLLSNQHYEWALFLFQKCSARWKYWQPRTEETTRRLKLAEDEIAECNRRMTHAQSPDKRPGNRRSTAHR
jgi:hypothetical protein